MIYTRSVASSQKKIIIRLVKSYVRQNNKYLQLPIKNYSNYSITQITKIKTIINYLRLLIYIINAQNTYQIKKIEDTSLQDEDALYISINGLIITILNMRDIYRISKRVNTSQVKRIRIWSCNEYYLSIDNILNSNSKHVSSLNILNMQKINALIDLVNRFLFQEYIQYLELIQKL